MAAKAPRSTGKAPDAYALADIRVLAKILNEYDLSEIEVERSGQRIRLRRERSGAQPAPFAVAPAPLAAAPATPVPPAATQFAAAEPAPGKGTDGSAVITSPFVGTFYRAPAPEAPPFVNLGETVKKGQVLCIVEAMKLMNEIEAEVDCKIVEILGKNGEPVEYGQPLFKVFPLA